MRAAAHRSARSAQRAADGCVLGTDRLAARVSHPDKHCGTSRRISSRRLPVSARYRHHIAACRGDHSGLRARPIPLPERKVPSQAHSPAWSRARHLDSDIATTMPTPSTSQTFPRDRSDAVCIIGTGPAGLSAARAFKAQGLDYDQFERHGDLVGIWDVGNPARRSTRPPISFPGAIYRHSSAIPCRAISPTTRRIGRSWPICAASPPPSVCAKDPVRHRRAAHRPTGGRALAVDVGRWLAARLRRSDLRIRGQLGSQHVPNLLTRALPLFARSAARGHRKYLASLQQRGLIRPRQGGWEVVPPRTAKTRTPCCHASDNAADLSRGPAPARGSAVGWRTGTQVRPNTTSGRSLSAVRAPVRGTTGPTLEGAPKRPRIGVSHRLRHLGDDHLRIAQQILRAFVAGGIAQRPVADLLRAEPTPQRARAAMAWRASSGCHGARPASLRSRSAIDSTKSLRDGGR